MKSTKLALLMLLLFCLCSSAGAVTRFQFWNDNYHLLYFDPDPAHLLPQDAVEAGLGAVPTLPSGVTLVSDLYFATTSNAPLTWLASVNIGTFLPGKLNATNIVLTSLTGGVPFYFQVQVRDASYATAAASEAHGSYFGFTDVFTVTGPTSVASSPIYSPNQPAFSTWAPGSYDMTAMYGGSGGADSYLGAVKLQVIPEPNVAALASALTALSLMPRACRARKLGARGEI